MGSARWNKYGYSYYERRVHAAVKGSEPRMLPNTAAISKATFFICSAPAAAGAFFGNAVIIVSPAMLDSEKFSDNDIRFILAHEVGHVARLDAYRFWTRWPDSGAAARELDADRIAVRLVGCEAMKETIARHRNEFLKGCQEKGGHHPHPNMRLSEVWSRSRQ